MNKHTESLTLRGNLIDASAGTGKTYQLANRFIALLTIGVPAAQMIALTFTRKAAGEFLTRIIRELAHAASSAKEADNMRQRINSTLAGKDEANPEHPVGCAPLCPGKYVSPQEATPAFFRNKLVELLHGMSALNLCTLDSFFNKVVSAHSVELGLGSISLLSPEEQEQAQLQALLTMLNHVSNKTDYADAFMSLFREVSDDKMRNMVDTLKNNINTYLPLYLNTQDNDIWGNTAAFGLASPQELKKIYYAPSRKTANELIKEYEHDIARLSEEKGCAAFRTFIKKMQAWNFSGMGNVIKAFEKVPSTNFALNSIVSMAQPIYEQSKQELLMHCLFKSQDMIKLLQTYCTIYKHEITATGKLQFEDITRAMPQLLNQGDMDVQKRLDFQLRHWMLDEFQDTSPQQWDALQPLLSEAISKNDTENGRSNHTIFVVGDAKQSIYGWRGASPELFQSLKTAPMWTAHLQLSSMSHSYRSAPIIMDFVNKIFAEEIKNNTFPLHQSAHTHMPGYVRVCALPDDLQAEQNEQACQEIGRILTEELHFTDGGISAAILVRKNADGELIRQWLHRHHPELPVDLLSNEKVAATTPLGEILLCFFRWLLHPSDTYSHSVLLNHPLCQHLNKEATSLSSWSAWRNMMDTQGYAAVLNNLVLSLAQEELTRDPSLHEWTTAAMEFDATGGSPNEWLLFIENKSHISEPPKTCVHIMTMHKSKGLEYDAVILPFLGSKSLCDTARMHYLEARDDEGRLQGILIPPSSNEQREAIPDLAPYIRQWKEKQLKEARNLLYVALTRAAHANYILLNGKTTAPKDDAPCTTYGAMLCKALDVQQKKATQITQLCDFGTPNWRKPTRQLLQTSTNSAVILKPLVPRRTRISPSRLTPPNSTEKPNYSSHQPTPDAADFGSDVHACWEQITWLHENTPSWLTNPETKAQKVVSAALQQPDIAALFFRKQGQEVYNEQSIEAINSQNEWISGNIDRLVLTHDTSGHVIAAHIIDFKTNHPTSKPNYSTFYAWLQEHYEPQLNTYRDLVANALNLPLNAISCSLISCPLNHPAQILNYPLTL